LLAARALLAAWTLLALLTGRTLLAAGALLAAWTLLAG
jgi:hypothetical protein